MAYTSEALIRFWKLLIYLLTARSESAKSIAVAWDVGTPPVVEVNTDALV